MARRMWIVIISGGAILALTMGLRQSLGLFLSPISADLGLGREVFALAMGLMNLLWGLGSPFAGAIADRFGPGRVAALGGLFYAIGLLVMALSGNGGQLVLGGVLIGIGLSGAGFSVILGAVGRAVSPEKRVQALALVSMGGSIGQFVTVPYAHVLLGRWGWVLSLFILASTAMLMVPLARGVAGKSTVATIGASQSLGEALKEASLHRGFWLLTAGFFVCGFHLAFIGVHLPAYLSDNGFAPWLATTALVLIGVFNMIGTYVAGALGSRFSKKNVLSLIYLGRALIFLVFLAAPLSEISVIAFSITIGLLWLGTVPLTSGLVAHIFGPAYMSMLYGIVFLSHQVGGFSGAWLAGILYDAFNSYDVMWWLNVALGVMSAALHWPIVERPVKRLLAQAEA